MFIRILRGTNVEGVGRVRAESVLKAPEDLGPGTAAFLVAIGHARDITPTDDKAGAPKRHMVTRDEELKAAGVAPKPTDEKSEAKGKK